ncbi:hypothetical protein FQN54_001542 [Arachnomyces sp. PD_36]|nr:hypothetical protein FQN54_001542 [Arachnomyces sp. PD_36]
MELGEVRDGYPSLAAWIARDPDNEAFVFRKFDRLAARNILHLQSRLIALEKEIDDLDEAARRSSDLEARESSRRWETLMQNAEIHGRPEKRRVEKMDELNGRLREYYKALLLQSRIIEFNGPSERVLSTFNDYIKGPTYKADDDMRSVPIISGRAKDFLSDKADLISLRKALEEDYLSKLLQDHWAFQKRKTSDPLDRTTIYKSHHVSRTVAAISVTLAAILLILAIITLYLASNPKVKLGLVVVYTVLFALSVALLTNARRTEVFAVTAAYAAVLVVFVSGDLGESRVEKCLVQLEGGIFRTVRCPG